MRLEHKSGFWEMSESHSIVFTSSWLLSFFVEQATNNRIAKDNINDFIMIVVGFIMADQNVKNKIELSITYWSPINRF